MARPSAVRLARIVYLDAQAPSWAFVRHSRGLYARTHVCVAYVACSLCGAARGELCVGRSGPRAGTHVVRRKAYRAAKETR